MNFVNLFQPVAWAQPYDGSSVVYVLRWDGKMYVGSTTNVRRRIKEWKCDLPKRRGVHAAEIAIVETVTANRTEREAFYITKLKTLYPLGHNRTSDGGSAPTEEATRNAMSASRTGKPRSLEARQAISTALLGRTFTNEAKVRMSNSHLVKTPSVQNVVRRFAFGYSHA